MDIDTSLIIQVIRSIKLDIYQLPENPTEKECTTVNQKYNILLSGDFFSMFDSLQLHHCLTSKYGMSISVSDLHANILDICQTVNAKVTPLYGTYPFLNDREIVPTMYRIEL